MPYQINRKVVDHLSQGRKIKHMLRHRIQCARRMRAVAVSAQVGGNNMKVVAQFAGDPIPTDVGCETVEVAA